MSFRTTHNVENRTPRVGVALGAGGAAALAQIGALEALADAGIPIHCVAGTSAGAVVGAAFASGRLTTLHERLGALSKSQVRMLFDPGWPRNGLLRGARALRYLESCFGENVEELPLPFAAVATDLSSGCEVSLVRGPVVDALRASIAIPGLFTPVSVDGASLVDGGLVRPVPVGAASALGADFVIAMNVIKTDRTPTTSAQPSTGNPGVFDVLWRSTHIALSELTRTQLRESPPDFLIQIELPEIGLFEIERVNELADWGRVAAEEVLGALRERLDLATAPPARKQQPVRHRKVAAPPRARSRTMPIGTIGTEQKKSKRPPTRTPGLGAPPYPTRRAPAEAPPASRGLLVAGAEGLVQAAQAPFALGAILQGTRWLLGLGGDEQEPR